MLIYSSSCHNRNTIPSRLSGIMRVVIAAMAVRSRRRRLFCASKGASSIAAPSNSGGQLTVPLARIVSRVLWPMLPSGRCQLLARGSEPSQSGKTCGLCVQCTSQMSSWTMFLTSTLALHPFIMFSTPCWFEFDNSSVLCSIAEPPSSRTTEGKCPLIPLKLY